MPRPKKFGTKYFGSLNTRVGPNNLEDTDLQICTNVRRDVAGEPGPSRETSIIYESPVTDQGYGRGIGVLVRSGTVAITYATDNKVYENGTEIGDSGGEITHRFLGDGLRTYVLNGYANRVWDGSNYRAHGAFSAAAAAHWHSYGEGGLTSAVVVGITAGAVNTTLDLATHGLATGDSIWLYSFSGGTWDTIDAAAYVVTYVDATHVTIKLDSTGLGAWSAGYWVPWPAGAAGGVKVRLSWRVTMPSGQIIESSAVAVRHGSSTTGTLDAYTLTADDQVRVDVISPTAAEAAAWASVPADILSSGTLYAVLWRTKSDGEDYWEAGTGLVSAWGAAVSVYDKHGADANLTVAWLDDYDGHDQPPAATMGVLHQQRLYLAGVTAYPSRLYYSLIGKYDYFPPTNYIECIDTITALGRFGEHVLIGTPAGIKLFSPVGTFGQLTDTQSPVGCEHPDSLCVTEFGTIFCRADGAWLFDGVTSKRISEPIDSLWQAASGTWRASYIAGHAYFTCGDDGGAKAFEFWKHEGGIEWSVAPYGIAGNVSTQPYIAVSGSPDDTYIYGMSADGMVVKLQGASTYHTMTVKTKAFGDGIVRRWMKARIDADSTSSLSVTVSTNRGNTETFDLVVTGSTPMTAQKRTDLPASMLGEECEVTISGKPSVLRSVVLETE